MLRPLIRPIVRPLVRGVTEPGYGSLAAQIRLLFAAGEQGAWYDPSDLSSMNTKHDGSGAVPGVGDPVGYIADKSGRGNHAKQTTDTARPTLQLASGRYYLQFDGVDDFLSTAAIDFTGTDKMTVVAGVRFDINAVQFVVDVGESGKVAGSCGVYARTAFGQVGCLLTGSGAANAGLQETPSSSAPRLTVVACNFDLAGASVGSEIFPRTDGVAWAAPTAYGAASAGSGNFASNTVLIGLRTGSLSPLNGRIYSLLIRGAASTAAQIAAAERYAAVKTGVTLA